MRKFKTKKLGCAYTEVQFGKLFHGSVHGVMH